MNLRPVTQAEAKAFVAQHHRHNDPPLGSICQIGLESEGVLVGVAILGRPVARMLQDGYTAEVLRTCTTGERNANSMLYGAATRVATGLGYRRMVTYTLESESGSSLKAAGWVSHGVTSPAGSSWVRESRSGGYQKAEHGLDLFGEHKMRPYEAKVRWVKILAPGYYEAEAGG